MSADYSDRKCNFITNEVILRLKIFSFKKKEFKLNEPRVSIDGSELPNARLLACNLHADKHDIEPKVSHLFMQWGQLVNHDITSLSITHEEDPDQSVS